jgi:hypothetical protein
VLEQLHTSMAAALDRPDTQIDALPMDDVYRMRARARAADRISAGGKVDRRRLPDPGPDVGAVARQPQTRVERGLAEIWSDLLRVAQLDVDQRSSARAATRSPSTARTTRQF